MSKRYEDEVRDLLNRMDRFPGDDDRGRSGRPQRPIRANWRTATARWISSLIADPNRIIGGALILTLGAWVLRGPWSPSYPLLDALAGIATTTSLVMFVAGLLLIFRRRSGAVGFGTPTAQRWRGNVIEMPQRGRSRRFFGSVRQWWQRMSAQWGSKGPRPR